MSKINKNVLIVEDQAFFREILEIALKNVVPVNSTIKKVSSGNQAIDLLKTEKDSIGLILLDMRMDDGDGLAVLNYLDENELSNIPIYIVSALEAEFISFVMQSIAELEIRLVGFLPKETPDSIINRIKNNKSDIEGFLTDDVKITNDEITQIASSVNCTNIMQLLESELSFYVQPKICLENGGFITGYEVLSRLYDENLGILTPDLFFPFLETLENKCIFQWLVIEKVFDHQHLNMNSSVCCPFSINIDADILGGIDFVNKLETIASRYDIDLRSIMLELTNVTTISDDTLYSNIKQLQLLGVKVSLDNFGGTITDFQQSYPLVFDEVKIDMRSHDKVLETEEGKEIFTSLYSYLKKNNCRVVAEGVEDKETNDFLNSIGNIEVQGYYYSMPKPISEIDELFTRFFKSRISCLLSDIGKESFVEIYNYFHTTTLESIDHYLSNSTNITVSDFVHKQRGALKTAGLYEAVEFIDMYKKTEDVKYLQKLKSYLTYFNSVFLQSVLKKID
ncbi:EAL domain-containing protein [Vibrio sp. MA40-2]|uniref:EAL domain-containing response regulator n=1 Tax=Vibrio sp. MA40-2 TaxID=3391828 RepID=UPI0039A77258